jgi:(4-(4-[2-(gamma-L-glutamylamino)ethyl]phenoxymethyl)furan-2-yl)methanamine synthase
MSSNSKSCDISSGSVVGWDIGAANIKAAYIYNDPGGLFHTNTISKPFEIWKEKDRLPEILREIFEELVSDRSIPAMAVTTTAELSDIFTTKREGVLYVFECLRKCFPDAALFAFSLHGTFEPLDEAWNHPLDFAASNWLASAQWLVREYPNGLLIDSGSTTTDILPILNGKVSVKGLTDWERLESGELIYTGALRTNVAAIVQFVPVRGKFCRVASEYFTITADVHLILGHLQVLHYNCSTPDGIEPSLESARRRLARLVCADTEMLSSAEIDEIAKYVFEQQIDQIIDGLSQILSRYPQLRKYPVFVTGAGSFLGKEAAQRTGMKASKMEDLWIVKELAVTPCVAVACLMEKYLESQSL